MRKEVVIDGNTYFVAKPTAQDEGKAKLQQSRVFNDALVNGATLLSQLEKIFEERGIFTEKDKEDELKLMIELQDMVEKLEAGGMDVMEARKLAIDIGNTRTKIIQKRAETRRYYDLTAEGQAENAYFDSLMASCCFNEDGTRVYKNYDDYVSKADQQLAVALANELKNLVYVGLDYLKELPENKFLKEFGFLNDDLEFINEEGNKVNVNYEPVKELEKIERKPFLKNGQPIVKG